MYRPVIFAVLVTMATICLIAPVSLAQDAGTPDTCRFTSGTWVINSQADSLYSVEMWGWIDDPNIRACSFGFRINSYGSVGYGPHVDSLIVVDTFIFNPDLTVTVKAYARSLLDMSIDPDAFDWGYNGFSIGLIDFTLPILPVEVPTKIGDVYLKILDRERVPEDFTIEIDSSFFPPAGNFKYSPEGGVGFAPEFIKSDITVDNDLTPKLLTIVPASGAQGEDLMVTITGYRTHFGQGSGTTTVFLSRGDSTITAYNVSISTATYLDADFSIPEWAETGDWDVTVSVTGFDDVTEENGFTINPPYLCGDVDASGHQVDVSDAVYLINYIFRGDPGPIPYASGDVDCSGNVDIDDLIYLINYLFTGGPAPCDPNGNGVPDC